MLPWNIAHRGGAGLAPENTLAAFRNAVAMGCDGAELDVQLSYDGEVVVHHDYRLNADLCRGPDGLWLKKPTPLIKDLSLSELRSYDVGRADPDSDYARHHADARWHDGERIPTLSDVIEACKKASGPFRLFVELKTSFSNREVSADPEALAAAALTVVMGQDFLTQTIFVGFDWPGLLHVKKLAPQAQCWFTTLPQSWFRDGPVPEADGPPNAISLAALRHWAQTGTSPWAAGFDAVKYDGSIAKAIKAAGGDGWFPYRRDATAAAVKDANALGLRVGAWTVDDPAEMRALSERGVYAICTDRPDIFARVANGE